MIQHPYVTEKATLMAEQNNTLQFIVDVNDTKDKVKKELEALYKVKVLSVNMMLTPKGKKKAIVVFEEPNAATELASRLGIF
ncbi:50S ribosomal protein L23 [Candidatus Methanoperedens nitratireducens]|jgi:large subunit ribosomal protein L23|uniref:Large ribosomal subunit protein uL23 n=1 Tax=Candidatus Methanoperedens nitratireducens TaxID=1392998 RepID=A0A284VN97_9EURY|nr:50S ribosomal protein L23 [Candidatus Methanoperedens nitroreducens]SNQ60708.1 50S ribosomal protein L23P [Candidatus Methanoperedens nitroreducens]